ncbi:MAG: cupin domain-containing protein [Leptolyngbyaceae cyanobacterium SM2_5_2]|nr:cupin domain-containing protein [Leptolyngbyaceae cyanobacterium SM2_5_2]
MQTSTPPTLTLGPDQGELLQVIEDSLRVLITGEVSDNAYKMFELTGPQASGPPPHYHPWSESYFVLEGEVDILVGSETVRATPGYSIAIPGGTVHTYRIASETAKFLVVASTVAASAFFYDLHQALMAGNFTLEDVMAIAARHQVMLAGSAESA